MVFRTYGTYCTLQMCGCVSFWFRQEIGFGFTYLCTYSTIQLWCCVNFLEIVIDVTYVLSVQYSCAVVSVFWLWREIVLKMRSRFYKKILTWRNPSGWPAQPGLTWRNLSGWPAQPATLALRGLEEPFFSFPVVLLCQFFVLAGNRLCFYILLMYLGVSYHKVVVLC